MREYQRKQEAVESHDMSCLDFAQSSNVMYILMIITEDEETGNFRKKKEMRVVAAMVVHTRGLTKY